MFEQPSQESVPQKEGVPESVEFKPITQAEVIAALNKFGITDPRGVAALREYEETLSAATDVIAGIDPQGAMRAEVRRTICMAQVYGASNKYKEEYKPTLEEALVLAS